MKQTIFNINTYIVYYNEKIRKTYLIRATYVEIQTSTTVIPQGHLTSDREIKQHT